MNRLLAVVGLAALMACGGGNGASDVPTGPTSLQIEDVVVVERVVDVAAVAARLHEPHAAQKPQLVRHRGLGETKNLGQVADRHLGPRERVEDTDARRIAEHLERLGEVEDRLLVEEPGFELDI